MAESRDPAPAGPAGDPSMEDILASIRRILNEEDTAAAPKAEPLALTEDMLVQAPVPSSGPSSGPPPGPPPGPSPGPSPGPQEPAAGPATPAPIPVSIPIQAEPAAAPQGSEPAMSSPDPLVAPAAVAAASASVGSLLRAVAAERHSAVSRGGPTIEDMVREELRPLLKDWLDQHLPDVVERLVRAEIERVVNRAVG